MAKEIAHELAKKQREISVAEFFEKNRHLLGYANKAQALLTSVKEAVDNALDACEEANILPEVKVELKELEKERYQLVVGDNGPGIVKKQIGPIFGKFLYGSKFQTTGGKQNRGQQGIGISSVVLYSQLTTGKPTTIISKIGKDKPAHLFVLHIDTKRNEPEILESREIEWENKEHGTKVAFILEGKYVTTRQSVPEYIKQTAVVNPHAQITFIGPDSQKIEYPRVTEELPKKPKAIKPHPYGVEIGILKRMLKVTKARNVKTFLTREFDKVGSGTADEIIKNANKHLPEDQQINPNFAPKLLKPEQVEALIKGIKETKIMNPSLDCLSPIGSEPLKKSIEAEYDVEFTYAITRPPSVYRGMPFQVEAAIGYGGGLEQEGTVILNRFANKVPLLYQQGACAITKAVQSVNWRQYGLQQSKGSLPVGPAIIAVHIASVWVPYTSEGKEAVASYPEIIKEIKLALQECGRHLQLYLGRKHRREQAEKKKALFEAYSHEVAKAISDLTGKSAEEIRKKLLELADKILNINSLPQKEEKDEGKSEPKGSA